MIKASSSREAEASPPCRGRTEIKGSLSAKLTAAPRLLNLDDETSPLGPGQEIPFDTTDAAQCATEPQSGASRAKPISTLDCDRRAERRSSREDTSTKECDL